MGTSCAQLTRPTKTEEADIERNVDKRKKKFEKRVEKALHDHGQRFPMPIRFFYVRYLSTVCFFSTGTKENGISQPPDMINTSAIAHSKALSMAFMLYF